MEKLHAAGGRGKEKFLPYKRRCRIRQAGRRLVKRWNTAERLLAKQKTKKVETAGRRAGE